MNVVKRNLGKLNRISKEKIEETLKASDNVLVCIPYMKQDNVSKALFEGKNNFHKVLVAASLKDCGFRNSIAWANDKSSCYILNVPAMSEFVNMIPSDTDSYRCTTTVDLSEFPVYELTPELMNVMMKCSCDILIDDDECAYIESEEYGDVYVLVGKRRTYNGKSHKNDNEVNGVFCEEDDAKKMGDMLKGYGRLNDIEYTGYEIKNFMVM